MNLNKFGKMSIISENLVRPVYADDEDHRLGVRGRRDSGHGDRKLLNKNQKPKTNTLIL